ncbi:S-adenosyl-L-methionine-dependent methyltransferase [Parachaetomium inaequale]|uniref:S-adenosyl-L-methionine-dependent methyltransferase n=1 Tax=Parachaetomium inaequale TaxID=2588326 RepID=A0AAN6P6B9_9PEZI|nr:S-adenosyl-L-methionine-dependent methyltransferase [Parachaetomium inaequale]
MSSSPKTSNRSPPESTSDWSPDQYLLFRQARDRPIRDLIAFLGPDYAPKHITDLGCGPGTSTALLAARFPSAHLTGVDSSPAMLARARTALPSSVASFAQADVRTYLPDPHTTDLLFSNAVFHWLRTPERLPTITRLLRTLPKGGVLALQVPDNYDEPSHRAMREAAAAPGPWRAYFAALPPDKRPELDPVEPVVAYYDALRPHCSEVEIWTTQYVHVLEDHGGIVEWVKGTGLQPFVNALPEEDGVREGLLRAYRERLEEGYPRAGDGKVLLRYPRRFMVAVR